MHRMTHMLWLYYADWLVQRSILYDLTMASLTHKMINGRKYYRGLSKPPPLNFRPRGLFVFPM